MSLCCLVYTRMLDDMPARDRPTRLRPKTVSQAEKLILSQHTSRSEISHTHFALFTAHHRLGCYLTPFDWPRHIGCHARHSNVGPSTIVSDLMPPNDTPRTRALPIPRADNTESMMCQAISRADRSCLSPRLVILPPPTLSSMSCSLFPCLCLSSSMHS